MTRGWTWGPGEVAPPSYPPTGHQADPTGPVGNFYRCECGKRFDTNHLFEESRRQDLAEGVPL